MAGLTARCIISIEIIDVMTFAFKALGTRWEQRAICDLVVEQLQLGIPRRGLVCALRKLAPTHLPNWKEKLEKWQSTQEEFWTRIYEAAETYKDLTPLFIINGTKGMIQALLRYADPCDKGDNLMLHAPTSTCFLESVFGCTEDLNETHRRCDIWNSFGIGLCTMSGYYITTTERLRRERQRLKAAGSPAMTPKEEVPSFIPLP